MQSARKELPLPDGFEEGNTVGINISPMIQENEPEPGITMSNYKKRDGSMEQPSSAVFVPLS